MMKFIELTTGNDDEIKTELINVAAIGRVYASPQNRLKCIVELSYHSVNDAPVYLEVESPYEVLRAKLIELVK